MTLDASCGLRSAATMSPSLVLLVLLAAVPCPGAGQHRNPEAKKDFKRAHPCPGGPDRGSTTKCSGYVVDHMCPLACCGLDAPQNMQWETEAEGKAKDKWEAKDCERTCAADLPVSEPKKAGRGTSRPAPNDDGKNPTARCKDGTLSNAKGHSGACSRHGGVAVD